MEFESKRDKWGFIAAVAILGILVAAVGWSMSGSPYWFLSLLPWIPLVGTTTSKS